MRRIIAVVLAAIIMVTLVAPAAEAARVTRMGRGYTGETSTLDSFNHGDTTLKVRHWYISGIRNSDGMRMTKVIKSLYRYKHGDSLNCGSGGMEWTSFNSYFWGQSGRNFNPGQIRLSCQHDGWNEKIVNYNGGAPWISHRDGRQQWKTNIEISWDMSPNQHDGMQGYFNWLGVPL